MTYTEEEAKTKWCPFARVYNGNHHTPAHNRSYFVVTPPSATCIASACMSWRALPQQYEYKFDGGTAAAPFDLAKPLPRKGFCGLAGQPNG